ncbi:hypothetical protein V6M85_07435 [Sulfolobus tengchongensis]|uniref:Uncharacterized protein n=1 Tax=Sulfolobus tengchongensis TaxID=207809 RepID=A0AAX4KYT6_9CREN
MSEVISLMRLKRMSGKIRDFGEIQGLRAEYKQRDSMRPKLLID